MASDLSKYFGNKLCRYLAGSAMPTAPTTIYTALFNGDPKASGTEVTTTVLAAGRLAMPVTAPASNATDNVLTSTADVDYGDSDGATSISHVAIFDAASGGNLLASKAVPGGTLTVASGTGVKFLAGDLTFTLGS